MKKFINFIIVLTVVLTGYCSSLLSNAYLDTVMLANNEVLAESANQVSATQIACCENSMLNIMNGAFSSNNKLKDFNLIAYSFPLVYRMDSISYSALNLFEGDSSPPYLQLTGVTISRT